MAITRTIKFTCPNPNTGPLQLEVTYDGGNTWEPYSFTQEYEMSGVDEKKGWSIPHWPTSDTEWTEYDTERSYFCEHKWVDTGMRRTFCKECNADGDYDPMTGKITVVYREYKK